MTPIRLAIIAVLFYIAWRVIKGMLRDKFTAALKKPKSGSTVQDVLVEDPVCHTLVPKHQAIRLRRGGKTYYFCSEDCCDTFTRNSGGEE